MKEEDIIKKLTEGRENPFRVPDGYFEGFTGRLMSRLPVEEPKEQLSVIEEQEPQFSVIEEQAETTRIRPMLFSHVWRYAAVLLVAVGVGLTFLFTNAEKDSLAEGDATEEYQEDYINDALDYALIGNTNIEIYLTEAY